MLLPAVSGTPAQPAENHSGPLDPAAGNSVCWPVTSLSLETSGEGLAFDRFAALALASRACFVSCALPGRTAVFLFATPRGCGPSP